MDKVIEGFLERNIPNQKENIVITINKAEMDSFVVKAVEGKVYIEATSYIAAFNGLYEYLKKYCNVQLSWCGNRELKVDKLVMFEGELRKDIPQKYRVYMNYCTLNYSMSWWNFDRWEKEIDFMALNGINMPLGVVGSEAVWYKTLLDLGLTKDEALSTVSGPAFWAWHLMTNIESYLPPKSEDYINERLALGKKIMERYNELGMMPIEQGFSGHVPMILKKKFPKANIYKKAGWCRYNPTAQLDPLDPLFERMGLIYLNNLKELFGNSHYIACDPFHEGVPPKNSERYLTAVGKAINNLYEKFDKDSIWVMQGWTPREYIIKAVPKDRLLILDISADRYKKFDKFYGYKVVAGMLHNFGGKNAMQGKIKRHADNIYLTLKEDGVNVVGSGMFMEGIEQNPVVYDLQFKMLTEDKKIDFNEFLKDYLFRRYKKQSDNILKAWDILLDTCYRNDGYQENEVGSTVAARPQFKVVRTGPCCLVKPWYNPDKLEKALALYLKEVENLKDNDGYQYDLCDLTRQVLSNRFYTNENLFDEAYNNKDIAKVKEIAKGQLELLLDLDELLSHRSEMTLSRWLCDAKKLATSKAEEEYFELNARALITLWGDINNHCDFLYDYSWREWNGLIEEYYYKRWQMFYKECFKHLESGKKFKHARGDSYKDRLKCTAYPFNKELYKFEQEFVHSHKDYEYPKDSDVSECAIKNAKKYKII